MRLVPYSDEEDQFVGTMYGIVRGNGSWKYRFCFSQIGAESRRFQLLVHSSLFFCPASSLMQTLLLRKSDPEELFMSFLSSLSELGFDIRLRV
ncbi:unnamed protein product [Rhodiola kirilowii]